MGLSCTASVIKYGIFIFNLLCAVAGIALIVVGAIPLFKYGNISNSFPDHNLITFPIIVIVIGSIVFIISFFGCCGAIRENQCMVSTYAFFLLVLVVLQIVLAVFIFLYSDEFANALQNTFETIWDDRNSQPAGSTVDAIQRGLQCCGRQGPNDWGVGNIPQSCCAEGTQQCELNNAFSRGCSPLIHETVSNSGLLIAWVSIVFAGIQLVGVIFACCLANSIRNASRRQYA